MIIIINKNSKKNEVENLKGWLKAQNFRLDISEGEEATIIGLVGDTSVVDIDHLRALPVVYAVRRVSEPYKLVNRKFHPQDTQVTVGNMSIGGGNFALIAGPCSVESEAQIIEIAQKVKLSGANMLRGGAFKPRTSPYAFQGLEADGLPLLTKAGNQSALPVVSEVVDSSQLPMFSNVDMIQVGARNMQNFQMLKVLGKTNKPILLKRGLANTIEELLMSAEYIMAGGNRNVVLCERGVRTFETATRNTLDLSAIPVIKSKTHLPVIVDPSHALGIAKFVKPMALAAVACGADGLIIEVHNDPASALCDGAQSVTPEDFDVIAKQVLSVRNLVESF